LLFQGNGGYANEPQRYVYTYTASRLSNENTIFYFRAFYLRPLLQEHNLGTKHDPGVFHTL